MSTGPFKIDPAEHVSSKSTVHARIFQLDSPPQNPCAEYDYPTSKVQTPSHFPNLLTQYGSTSLIANIHIPTKLQTDVIDAAQKLHTNPNLLQHHAELQTPGHWIVSHKSSSASTTQYTPVGLFLNVICSKSRQDPTADASNSNRKPKKILNPNWNSHIYPPSEEIVPVIHTGITCDGCRTSGVTGIRHQCWVCHDFDLCHQCFLLQAEPLQHKATHPMKHIGHDSFGKYDILRDILETPDPNFSPQTSAAAAASSSSSKLKKIHALKAKKMAVKAARGEKFKSRNYDSPRRELSFDADAASLSAAEKELSNMKNLFEASSFRATDNPFDTTSSSKGGRFGFSSSNSSNAPTKKSGSLFGFSTAPSADSGPSSFFGSDSLPPSKFGLRSSSGPKSPRSDSPNQFFKSSPSPSSNSSISPNHYKDILSKGSVRFFVESNIQEQRQKQKQAAAERAKIFEKNRIISLAKQLSLILVQKGQELGSPDIFADYIRRLSAPNETLIRQICDNIGQDYQSLLSTVEKQLLETSQASDSTSSQYNKETEIHDADKVKLTKIFLSKIFLSSLNPMFPESIIASMEHHHIPRTGNEVTAEYRKYMKYYTEPKIVSKLNKDLVFSEFPTGQLVDSTPILPHIVFQEPHYSSDPQSWTYSEYDPISTLSKLAQKYGPNYSKLYTEFPQEFKKLPPSLRSAMIACFEEYYKFEKGFYPNSNEMPHKDIFVE